MNKKNIIFDLGGVLFHWNPQKTVEKIQEEDPAFPSHEIIEIPASEIWKQLDAGLLSLEQVVDALSLQFSRAHVETFLAHSLANLVPIELGVSILNRVQAGGYPTYILSNISEDFLRFLTPRNPFLQSFNGAVFSYEVQSLKPDKRIYEELFARYQLDPGSCLFIDDLPQNIATAQELGMSGIVCRDHTAVEAQLREMRIIV